MGNELKFHRMWQAANTYVLDVETGSALSIIHKIPKIASFADTDWLYYFENGMGSAYYEESGITSHAAIISRELGIPCVIGAKIATQVVKNGDTIEIEANTGVIKIIKTN